MTTTKTMMKKALLGLFVALLALAAQGLGERGARAQGLLGVGEMSVGGSAMFGSRLGGGGFGLAAHFEVGMLVDETALGHWMGFEFATDIGYEQFDGEDPNGGEWTQGPLVFDMSVGFPITLLKLGSGGTMTTLFTFSLGGGFSVQHAYGYARLRVLMLLTQEAYLEVRGTWTPSEASNDWTKKTGLDVYALRASVFADLGDDTKLEFFGEWTSAERARDGAEDETDLTKWPVEAVEDFENVVRIGVGYVF